MTTKTQQLKKIALLLKLKKMVFEEEVKNKDKKRREINRRFWVKPLLIKRCEMDLEAHLLKDLLWEDDDSDFNNFCRLGIVQFEEILEKVQSKIAKQDTNMRAAISSRVKLAITLRYLATGDSFSSLQFLTRVSKSTNSVFIPIVLGAIYDALENVCLKVPDSKEEWEDIARDFNDIWQFPHTLGALDGKHVRIKAPSKTGSQFYNFKGYFSIVLFAAVDAHSRFLFIDVGSNGKASDSSIYKDCFLYNALENGDLNIPNSRQLVSGQGNSTPFFFIGDDAFSLDKHLMKPYSRSLELSVLQEIFNYRLCRARMVVECAFGRLAKRFGIFNRPIEVQTSTVDITVMTACALHNYLTKKKTNPFTADFDMEIPTSTFSSIGHQNFKTYKYACRVRDEVSRYLLSDGNVDFQWKKINIK